VQFGVRPSYNKGEEYSYSYVPKASNHKLLLNYGFYLNTNYQNNANLYFPINKSLFTKEKYQLALKLQNFEIRFDDFFVSNKQNANLQMPVNAISINKKALITMKIYVIPLDKFYPKKVYNALKNNKWISYNNEIQSNAIYLYSCLANEKIVKYVRLLINYLAKYDQKPCQN